MTIAITSSGIALDGPLVAGEKVAVTVSGLALAAEDKPTLALLARFPDALLASVELTESDTPGTWTGELDTATKQTALFFATARADERRDAALELVAGRVSLARLTVPMANSALCPNPDGSPFASPVYVPVPGPPGTGGDPYDQNPAMDGTAAPGVAEEYARGDHVHPTDTSRASTTALSEGLAAKQDTIADLAAIRSGAAAGYTAVQPDDLAAVATTGDYADLLNKPAIPAAQIQSDWNQTNSAAVDFIKNKPTIPGPAPVTSVNGDTGDVEIYGNTLLMEQSQSTTVSAAIANAQEDATSALNELAYTANSASIAPAFSTSSTYAVGDYVTREGLLYKCTTAVSTAGAWNAANWTATNTIAEMPSGGAPSHNIWAASCTSSNGVAYVATPYGGDFSLVDGAMIVFEIPMTNAGDPTINVGGTGAKAIYEVRENLYWPVWAGTMRTGAFCILQYDSSRSRWNMHGYASINSPVLQKMPMAENLAVGTTPSQNALANGFPSLASGNNSRATGLNSVALGQAVYAGGQAAFACNQGGDAAGFGSFVAGRRAVAANSGDAGSASSPHAYAFAWQGDVSGGSTTYYHSHGDGTFNINPVPASGSTDPATGFWIGETKLSDYVRYSFTSPTPSVSGTTATVACEDRAINDFTVATGITSLTITPPAAVTGRARDFFCRVTLTDSSLPTVTLSGGTIDIGATEVAGMTQGVNLLMFTEISSGHWLASRRSAS